MTIVGEQPPERIVRHAFEQLSFAQRETSNVYFDDRFRPAGSLVGPEHQGIVAERDSVVVFVDHDPLANFGHQCTYLFYDAESGEFAHSAPASFPPTTEEGVAHLLPIHQPVRFTANRDLFRVRPFLRCPIIWPDGNRWALLYSGMSNLRHLNDMEFLYRTLVDRYGVPASHIFVCNYDGTLNTQDGYPTLWPGDDTDYRIQVTHQGTQAGFEDAVDELKTRLGRDDLLLIHTNNHGDWNGTHGSSFICTYPGYGAYYATDFTAKLAELPRYEKLIVMMEQCNSGGFNDYVIANSTADATSIASAAIESKSSYASNDGHWDSFARDWISAQAGHDPYGATLASNPDANGDGRIDAQEAYAYANSIRNPNDTPNYSQSSAAGGEVALGQEYVIWWWWCFHIRYLLSDYYRRLPIPQYYELLHRMQPELVKLVRELDDRSDEIRESFQLRAAEAVRSVFE